MNLKTYQTINESDIEQELEVCPYCMNDYSGAQSEHACCGEVHTAKAWLMTNGDVWLDSEVTIEPIKETKESRADAWIKAKKEEF